MVEERVEVLYDIVNPEARLGFQYFKKFYAMVEREKGVSLKCLHSDNRGE